MDGVKEAEGSAAWYFGPLLPAKAFDTVAEQVTVSGVK